MELTKEMKNCMVQHFTIIDGFAVECSRCKVNNGHVPSRNGICVVFLDCLEWLKEQKVE